MTFDIAKNMENIQEKIKKILYEIEPAIPVNEDTDLFESGILDSMGVLYLITELEDYYKIEIPMELVVPENFNTIDHIIQFVKTQMPNI